MIRDVGRAAAVRAVLRGAVHAVDLIVRRQMLARRGAEVRIPLLHALQTRGNPPYDPVRPPTAQPMLQPSRPYAFELWNDEDPNRRDLAADTIGCLLGYAHLANTRSLALVDDPVEMAYYIPFSFSSPAEKKRCLDLIRSDDDLGREYIENDLVQPTEEEIRDARPPIYVSRGLFMVNPRVLLCAAIPLLLLVQFSPAQSSQDQGTPTLRVDSNLVFLDVTVLDKKGIPVVKGLTRDDFTITEDGKPQRIFSFETPKEHTAGAPRNKQPVNIIVLDLLNSRFEDFAYIRYSVRKFLLSQPETLAAPAEMLVIGNQSLDMIQGYTRSRADLLYALEHLPAALPWKFMLPSFFWERFVQSIGALQQIALQNRGVQGRKNVIWVGHGGPNIMVDSISFPGDSGDKILHYVHATTNLLVDSRISLFVIYPGLPVSASVSYSGEQANADIGQTDPFAGNINFGLFVNETGGKLFYNRNDVDVEIRQSEQLGSNYYTLTYQPPNSEPDGKFRRIRVRLRVASLRVVTKAGYYAPTNNDIDPQQRQMVNLADALQATVPFGSLGLSVIDVVRHPDTRTVEFTAVLKTNNLNFIPGADGKFTLGIIAAAASLDRNRDILASRMREETLATSTTDPKLLPEVATRISFTVPVTRRTTTIRVAVEDQDRGRIGTAEIDRKLIQNAPQAPTPNPTLHPRSNRPASSAP